MKALIEISGQINGNFTLKNKIERCDGSIQTNKTMFNGFRIHFETVEQAKKALKKAYKDLVYDEPEMKNKIAGISLYNETLMYDASKATIFRNEN